jgi:predicted peroxiredoxin
MKFIVAEQFKHKGKDYEIRLTSDGVKIWIKPFCGNQPANGYIFGVEMDGMHDLKNVCATDEVKELIRQAKNDVLEGRWETYLKALKSIEADADVSM